MVRPGMCILKVSFIVFSLAGVASSQQLPATDAQAAEIVSRNVPGFRLAEPGDFVPELHEVSFVDSATQSAFSADFDQDGRDDWAVLAVSDGLPEYRIYYALAGDSGFRLELLFSRVVEGSRSNGLIRNAIFLKEIGDLGIAGHRYAGIAGSPLDPDNFTQEFGRERAARMREYESLPAIEVWTGPARIDTEDLFNWPDAGIAYCSETWYFRSSGELATFGACD
jgi:hypothetical protein